MYDIVVLGAGIVGLSTAVNIQSLVPGRTVTIVADRFNRNTTSDGAAGIFRPAVEKTPVRDINQYRKWCRDSFQWFHKLNIECDPSDTGVQRLSGYHFSDGKSKPPEFYYELTEITEHELQQLPGHFKHGWRYTTLMIECRRYLPWLTNMFLTRGGQIEKRTVRGIDEFAGRCSILVNCAGLGSEKLFNDRDMFSVRGHLMRVRAPWIKHFYVWDDAASYIYPGHDNVVLGGTRQRGQYDTTHSQQWFDDIKSRCERVLPGLKNVEVEGKWIGLRPHRSFIKLEPENVVCGGQSLQVVHNYGHGANGVALSWGTSVEAAQLVRDVVIGIKSKL